MLYLTCVLDVCFQQIERCDVAMSAMYLFLLMFRRAYCTHVSLHLVSDIAVGSVVAFHYGMFWMTSPLMCFWFCVVKCVVLLVLLVLRVLVFIFVLVLVDVDVEGVAGVGVDTNTREQTEQGENFENETGLEIKSS